MADHSSPSNRLAAHHAGLSTFRLRSNKRPAGEWRSFMTDLPDEADIVAEAERTQGYAVVCGQISDRLIVFDFEAGFTNERWRELIRRLEGAGLADNFANWCAGYTVRTPSGGLHVAVHVIGDGPLPGNTKLAMAEGKVIAETRAEGGYVVGPGSNGDTHPTGKAWTWYEGSFEEIAWDTIEVVEAVCAIIASFGDVTESASTPSITPLQPRPSLAFDSWIDEALLSLAPIDEILLSHGWSPARSSDQYGQHWTRPDKDPREGHSASLNRVSSRLYVHSTNAGLETGNPTHDALDVILGYELGRRPTSDERVAYLRQLRPDRPGGEAVNERARQAAEPASTDPTLYLPEDFWQARPWLGRVREAAMRRMISPDAVLGALLSAYATTIPMGIRLPAIVGQWAPLNLYSVLVSRSGGGKTSAMGLADQLLGPVNNPDILFRSLRSGEGLINLAARKVGKDELPSYRCGVQIAFDEGGVLSRQTERSGSTTIPYLNTAWAGHGMVGGAKASEDGFFPASLVRICAVIGVQFGAAANLFMGESQILGFPQRLTFYGLDHPDLLAISRADSDYSPIKALGLPQWEHSEFTRNPMEIQVPDQVADEVWGWTRSKHGPDGPSTLDGHMMNLRLRIAAVVALASGEGAISEADWDLASQIESTSRSLRQALLASLGDITKDRARAAGTADATREIAKVDVFLEKAALSVARKVQGSKVPVSRREVRDHIRSMTRRYKIDYREAIATALDRGWVLSTEDGALVKGPV